MKMTKSQTHQEEMLSKDQIAKSSPNETPKPPAGHVTSESPPMTPTPGPPQTRMSPTETLQPFYGTRLLVINNSDNRSTTIISDMRLDVRVLDPVLLKDTLKTDDVLITIKDKSYVFSPDYMNGMIELVFNKKLVNEIFQKIDSETTTSKIKELTWELSQKKEKLVKETEKLLRLEEELKWLQHEQKKQIPEDVTNELFEE